MSYQFETEVTDIDIYGADENTEGVCSSASVEWTCEIEMRSFGIKGINIYPTSVKCSVMLSTIDFDEEEESELTVDSINGWILEKEMTDVIKLTGDIFPGSLSIDLKTKTITVNF